ncbi:cytochrome P450 [Phanerochaete sordida]|uniref:Cytochrome P450 n=1 Tax=Phanerochaete sordida TaxID=48140 RepID=A0A9P3LFI5_9APHY|nr:cytochrome P450 [Phanerochaete sordida]
MESNTTILFYGLLASAAVVYLARWYKERRSTNVPAIGPTAPLLSYWGAVRFMLWAQDMLEEGHVKYSGRPFRIRIAHHWHYIVSTRQLVDELRRAREDELSFVAAATETLQIEYTLGKAVVYNMYHLPIVRTTLPRNMGKLYATMHDEICVAFKDSVPANDDWTSAPALDTMMQIVARTSARVIVGLPLCRNSEMLDVIINFTVDVVTTGIFLSVIPGFMRPLAKATVSRVDGMIDRALVLLRPVMDYRRTMAEKHGEDWPGKPNDMLQWLMDAAEDEEREPRALATRFLLICFVSIHTTAVTLTQALYRLAANPEYASPLREEIANVVAEEGWSKAALQKMRKLDSFFRECQRMDGVTCLFMIRKAVKDFTFSDGTTVPAGSYVSTSAAATHGEEAYYDAPHLFDPWRFSRLREEPAQSAKHQMVNTSLEYLAFGLGQHACPGRFFAASELKTMLAHLVMNYDVRTETPGVIPPAMHVSNVVVPNRTAKVLFRKRRE